MVKTNKHTLFLLALMLLFPLCANAQEEEDNSFGGWHFVEVDHQFGDSK